MKKTVVTAVLILVLVPAVIFLGGIIFKDKYYSWLSLSVAVLSCVPLFYAFERKESNSKELTVIAVLVALSAMGRFVFAWVPGFKPVTAVTVIAAIYLGREAGFAVGALSAVVSNFYFGQGPWTPFQMFAWGFLGFLAGVLAKPLQKNKILLCAFGALAGVVYSLTMDIWTTLWADGYFNFSRYIASAVTALPVTVSYGISNVIFLLSLSKPIGKILSRLKTKYGLFMMR